MANANMGATPMLVTPVNSAGVEGGQVQGNVASGATDSGNPVKIGGVFNTTLPILTNGQRSHAQLDSRGNLRASLVDANGTQGVTVSAGTGDAVINGVAAVITRAFGGVFNGTTWDRASGNTVAQSVLPGLSSTFWSYSAASGGIVSSTAGVTIKAEAGASVRNYISNGSISWGTLSAITEFVIRDGAAGTVIYRTILPTVAGERKIPSYLRSTANTLLEIATLTSVTGGVYFNCQGFTGA